jgi:hypothetical protein
MHEFKLAMKRTLQPFNASSIPEGSTLASPTVRRMVVAKGMFGHLGANAKIEPQFFVWAFLAARILWDVMMCIEFVVASHAGGVMAHWPVEDACARRRRCIAALRVRSSCDSLVSWTATPKGD